VAESYSRIRNPTLLKKLSKLEKSRRVSNPMASAESFNKWGLCSQSKVPEHWMGGHKTEECSTDFLVAHPH
jgi:hypothetical protein